MRRTDREVTEKAEIEAILQQAGVLRIGLSDSNGPYIVPVCFGFDGGALYIHSAPGGKKIAMLNRDPRCCFEADICNGIIRGSSPCSWACGTGA